MPMHLFRQPNFAALVVLVWLLVALALLLQHWPQTAETLLDTDDAMRLVQMRTWLGGPGLLTGWFDFNIAQMQPPLGAEMHWSRLIDAGLAGLLFVFQLFADQADAERLMRAWWPLLWLLPTMAGMVMIAWRLGGRDAAMVALLLAMVGVPAYQQFTPGRIDHHNVQIALALLAAAATVWSDRKDWAAYAAGALSGAALAIGFESLPYLAMCGAAFAGRYVADRHAGPALWRYGLGLAAATAVAFAVSVGPAHWMRGACDAIATNSAAAAACGGLVLALAGWLAHRHRVTRIAAVLGSATAAAAALLLLEPRCVGGPMAMIDPAIRPIWFNSVREMQPLIEVWRINPLTASAITAFPVVALLAVVVLVRDNRLRRDFGFIAAATIFLAAAITTVGAIRAYSYAMWFGMPLVALLALRLFVLLRLKRAVARITVALALTPMALASGAIGLTSAAGLDDTDNFSRPASRACFASANYSPLRGLEPGLIAADISLGPYLLALTRHSVLAGPYHRLTTGIVTAHRSLASPPDEAREVLLGANAAYVVVCGSRPPDGLPEPARSQSLWGRLQGGIVPEWLEPLKISPVFSVYRVVRPSALGLRPGS
jgi:hypothetical protein